MSIHIIPVNKLSATALKGVIEEFITRCGTDYGTVEAMMDTKFRQVKDQLKNGTAVLYYVGHHESMTSRKILKESTTSSICSQKQFLNLKGKKQASKLMTIPKIKIYIKK
jgi:uncharacterized protein YheU (UPF0270 family)